MYGQGIYLRLDPEGPATGCLALLFLGLWSSTAQYLQEVGGPLSHSRVDISLGGLDVIVEVVAEGLNVRDDIGHALSS